MIKQKMKNKTVRFRIKEKFSTVIYYVIQKKYWFGWHIYDTVDYYELEKVKARLKEIKDNYPNIHPKRYKVIDEIEIDS